MLSELTEAMIVNGVVLATRAGRHRPPPRAQDQQDTAAASRDRRRSDHPVLCRLAGHPRDGPGGWRSRRASPISSSCCAGWPPAPWMWAALPEPDDR